MFAALKQALALLTSGDGELLAIVLTTLRMGVTSSVIALLLGAPLGALYAMARFPLRRALIVVNRTLMGLPPVVCGLVCYLLFSGVGPLRHWKLLYTVNGMIIAQIILITPIVAGMTHTHLFSAAPGVIETARGLGFGPMRTLLFTFHDSRRELLAVYLLGFGRAMAEVGAVSMVGGAIMHKTNVMTTAIMQRTNMGDFTMALALGVVLLGVSLAVNLLAWLLQRRDAA